MGILNRKAG